MCTRWLVGAIVLLASAAAGEEGGREVFARSGCPTCHPVDAEGIKAKVGSGPDLSVAAGREAEWLESYLRKRIRNGDREHPTAFQGSPAEIGVLISWIRALDDPE